MDIYLASGNKNKVDEFKRILEACAGGIAKRVKLYSANELGGMPHVVEDSGTYLGNARLKAAALFNLAPKGSFVLADDSGIEIDALNGAPGVETAYFAGPYASAFDNNAKMLRELQGVPLTKRGGVYKTCLYIKCNRYEDMVFSDEMPMTIAEHATGDKGWGYEPIIIPQGHAITMGQMTREQKARLVPRRKAFERFILPADTRCGFATSLA